MFMHKPENGVCKLITNGLGLNGSYLLSVVSVSHLPTG